MKRLTSWSIAVVLLGGAAVAQLLGTPREVLLRCAPLDRQLSTGFAWDRNAVQRIELRGRTLVGGAPSPEVELRILPLDPESANPPRALWSGGMLVPAWFGSLSFVRSTPGACAAVGTRDGGAYRNLAVWWSSEGLDGDARQDSAPPMVFDSLRELRLIDTPGPDGHALLRARDLYDPSLIEWRDALHLVATAYGALRPDGPTHEFVWTAPLASELSHAAPELGLWERGVDGCVIAMGVDARVVRTAGEVIVALRTPTGLPEEWGDAPVQFYRSADLIRWKLDLKLSAGRTARSDYTIAIDGETLWIATSTDEHTSQIAVHRFDRTEKAWQEWTRKPANTDLPSPASARGRIWLLARGSGGGGFELLYVDPRGELSRSAL